MQGRRHMLQELVRQSLTLKLALMQHLVRLIVVVRQFVWQEPPSQMVHCQSLNPVGNTTINMLVVVAALIAVRRMKIIQLAQFQLPLAALPCLRLVIAPNGSIPTLVKLRRLKQQNKQFVAHRQTFLIRRLLQPLRLRMEML